MKSKKNKSDNKKEESFDYKKFEQEAISKLRAGKGLTGPDGALTSMIQRILQAALDGEMDEHIKEDRPNRRNGYTDKQVQTSMGPVDIDPPRDRNGSFEPKIIGKWERRIAPDIENQILSLYGMGNSYEDISSFIEQMYGVKYSTSLISSVTDRIWDEVDQWRKRPLNSCYSLIYLDAIHYKVRDNGRVVTKAIYTVFGVDLEGERDVLGLYIDQAEGARFWGRILEDVRDRGVEDVLFFSIDGLKGFSEVIQQIFPSCIIQRCIVHMIRTSLRYVSYKDYKPICKDLRTIYTAFDEQQAMRALKAFADKWDVKYPEISKKWEANWVELSAFFDFPEDIRRMIYTTNAVEALHRLLRKTTKTKGAMVNDNALIKILYLTLKNNQKTWKRRARNWPKILTTLRREFGNRINQYL
jgi:transposase-like protein